MGDADTGVCAAWDRELRAGRHPVPRRELQPVRAPIAAVVYNAATNPTGVRCTVQDYQVGDLGLPSVGRLRPQPVRERRRPVRPRRAERGDDHAGAVRRAERGRRRHRHRPQLHRARGPRPTSSRSRSRTARVRSRRARSSRTCRSSTCAARAPVQRHPHRLPLVRDAGAARRRERRPREPADLDVGRRVLQHRPAGAGRAEVVPDDGRWLATIESRHA